MPKVSFHKMNGLGNDFVILDRREASLDLPVSRLQMLSDRKRGIGADQILVLEPSRNPKADVLMRIFNADGSEASACGNGTRCVAWLISQEKNNQETVVVETIERALPARVVDTKRVEIDMGIPAVGDKALCELAVPFSEKVFINMGNPHVVFFSEDLESHNLAEWGAKVEKDNRFEGGVNVNFASLHGKNTIKLHVWERGTGFTDACGTGGCATATAAFHLKKVNFPCDVHQPGGILVIDRKPNGHLTMTGDVYYCFQGTISLV